MENEWIARVVLFVTLFGSGILIFWMAHAAASGRLKRNAIAGIRTPSTMASEEAWLAAHVRAKTPTLYAGAAAAAGGLVALAPIPMPVITVGVLVAAVVMLVVVLYAARVGGAAARGAAGT